ncbi:MAG: cysteine--tRNA ligase [Thermogutta sp.]|nr:cysteine--tRNA ligase [Thermogutta sp.]
MIRVYNTLTRKKEVFEPVQPGKVGIYLCGPTVYKPSHIGHMVGPIIFDAIKRYLTYNGYKVTWVVNITDVDDKLIAESERRGIPMSELAEEMIADYMANLQALGIDGIDHFPRATENIDAIITFTEDLIRKGYAYPAGGDVYFDVSKVPDYGKLSRRKLESMLPEGGEGVERKRSPYDFALWKGAKPNEPFWNSPWGPGRPGWHIECSVMSSRLLGETFDIHGGGLDLIFPHHENEIAQSEARHGKPMVRYWMHNGLMQAADEIGKVGGRNTRVAEDDLDAQQAGKISKSKGASPFRDLLKEYRPETIRLFILSTHYRRPIEFSERRLQDTETAIETFYRFFERFERITRQSFYSLPVPKSRKEGDLLDGNDAFMQDVAGHRARFLEFMDDDFNTGGAIGELFELVRRLNRFVDEHRLEDPQHRTPEKTAALVRGATVLRELGHVLGLFRQPPPKRQLPEEGGMVAKLLDLLVSIRSEARKAKNFQMADRIRSGLAELGVVLEDRPDGTQWRITDQTG